VKQVFSAQNALQARGTDQVVGLLHKGNAGSLSSASLPCGSTFRRRLAVPRTSYSAATGVLERTGKAFARWPKHYWRQTWFSISVSRMSFSLGLSCRQRQR